jgi:hypothetical protein
MCACCVQRGACRYSMNFGRSSGSGRLPKLTLLNLLEDWKAQQATRALRRSLTAERRSGIMAAAAAGAVADVDAKPSGGSSRKALDRGGSAPAKLPPLASLPPELPSAGSLGTPGTPGSIERAASLDRSMLRPPKAPQPKARSFT